MSTKIVESKAHQGKTASRHDTWWVEPAMVATGFALFIIYGTFRALENNYFEIFNQGTVQYLSPFYSPKIDIEFLKNLGISPAFLILWIPGGFRATCYYYRKAYYRAYFWDPPACAVSHHGGTSYCGEKKFPLVFQNYHRYFFYLATIILAFLWYDVALAFFPNGHLEVSVLGLVMLANVILLSGYSGGCHACRHLCGGGLNCFSDAKGKFEMWKFITKLNEHHMGWAWASLFSVGFTDFYVRQVATGAWQAYRLF